METVPSENILALRILSEKLSNVSDTQNYQDIIKEHELVICLGGLLKIPI